MAKILPTEQSTGNSQELLEGDTVTASVYIVLEIKMTSE